MIWFFNKFGRIFLLFFSLIITVLLNRTLGDTAVATYGVATTYVSFFSTMITIGLGQTILSEISDDRINDNILNILIIISGGAFITLIIGSIIRYFYFLTDDVFVYLFIATMQSYLMVNKSFFIIKDKIYLSYLTDIIYYMVFILLILLAYFKVNISVSVMMILSNIIISFYFLFNIKVKFKIDLNLIRRLFVKGIISTISVMLMFICLRFNIFFSESFSSVNNNTLLLSYLVISMFIVDGASLFFSSIAFAEINKIKNREVEYFSFLFKYIIPVVFFVIIYYFFLFKIVAFVYAIRELNTFKELSFLLVCSLPFLVIIKISGFFILMRKMYGVYLIVSVIFVISLFVSNINTSNYIDLSYGFIKATVITSILSSLIYKYCDVKFN